MSHEFDLTISLITIVYLCPKLETMQNKVTIITGASSGIGKALAAEAHKRGAKVVLSARRKEMLDEITSSWNTADYISIQTDVTREEDCRRLNRSRS